MESFGLMHRLDAQTSGVLLCAKSYTAACWIWTQWDSHDVTKEYVALVHGCVDPHVKEICKRVRVDCDVVGSFGNKIYLNGTVSDSGKPAYTEVATLAHLSLAASETNKAGNEASEEQYSLVVLKIHTGRTQQIRVHMQAIGHPLVHDIKHADSYFPTDCTWCPRNFLHTYHLGFLDVPEDSGLGKEAGSSEVGKKPDLPDFDCPAKEEVLAHRLVKAGVSSKE